MDKQHKPRVLALITRTHLCSTTKQQIAQGKEMYQGTSLFVQNTQDNQAKEDEQKQLSIFSSGTKAKKQVFDFTHCLLLLLPKKCVYR